MSGGFAAACMVCLCILGNAGLPDAAPVSRLDRGIELFRAGSLDAALVEFRAVVAARPHTPLAYYYAAHIRYSMGQYPQARKNLLAALEDSSSFHDASGLLACTDLKMGNVADAVIEWKRFTAAVGRLAPNEQVTASSIMLPEDYRARLNRARMAAVVDSTASRVLAGSRGDTSAAVRSDTVRAGGMAVTDLDRRIESQIRAGYYTIGGAIALLVGGAVAIILWMRRRRKAPGELTFDSEVGRFAAGLPAVPPFESETEDGEDEDTREFASETRVRPYPAPEPAPHRPTAAAPRPYPEESPVPRQESPSPVPVPVPDDASDDMQRGPITGEVKALVARLHHEGRDIVDIARIADLTRTEVELIVAVRARKTEQLVQAVAEEDDTPDGGALHQAVRELSAEGRPVPDIARRLGVSTSEVKLAMAVMEKRRERR